MTWASEGMREAEQLETLELDLRVALLQTPQKKQPQLNVTWQKILSGHTTIS